MPKGVKLKAGSDYVYPCPFFPVGSIYMSVNSTNPSTYFGGTWEEIQGRFLLGRSSNYTAGSQGGEATHALTANEMPSHTHSCASGGSHTHEYGTGHAAYISKGAGGTTPIIDNYTLSNGTKVKTTSTGSHTHTIGSSGSGQSHNNMPPYLAVYIWKRTA